jgi:N-acetylneuraminic acid mutarotase
LIRTVEEYDPNANKWTLLTEEHSMIPTPRWYCAAVTGSNGRIYLIGGCYSCGSVTDAVEEFDPVGKKWRVLSPMPTARAAPVAVATPDGRLLVLGGERMMTYHSASMGIDYEEWGVTDEIEEGTLPTIFP